MFRCGLLIDPASGKTVSNALIETNGGKILRVGKDTDFSPSAGERIIDFSGKYIIPGLVDTHGHLYSRLRYGFQPTDAGIPVFYLAAGVTSVGDPGSMDAGGDFALRNRINSGRLPGLRFFLAGEYIDMAPLYVPWMDATTTPEEARFKVDMWAAQGAAAIKIYASAKGDVMRAAIAEAHEHSMRVWAHVSAVTFQEAMDAGVDQLFHGATVMSDTRPAGLSADYKTWAKWQEATGALDLTRPEIQEVFRTAAQRKVVLTPTAVVIEIEDPDCFQKHYMEEQKRFYTAAGWEHLQKLLRDSASRVNGDRNELRKNKEFIRRAYDAKCMLSTGTDYVLLTMLPGWICGGKWKYSPKSVFLRWRS